MKKKLLVSLLSLASCSMMFTGCGEKEAAIEPTESLVAEVATEATEKVVEATEVVVATEEIATETETEEIVEETESESETEQNSETKSSEEDEPQATSESEEIVASPEQSEVVAENESTQAVSENAPDTSTTQPTNDTTPETQPTNDTPSNDTPSSGDIIYNGSVTLPSLGISIVCPNQYVSSGLTYNDILNNANAFTNAANKTLGDAQGMTWNGNAYGFYVLGYNSTPQSQIKYNGDGTYTLIIGAHFGGGYQCLLNDYDLSSMNADAILCEIATMSSTPQSVYNKIYDIIYGDSMYDANTWYTAGDCKIMYSSSGSFDPMSQVWTIKKA